MQVSYVWIITIMANVLIVTSLNRERPKRDLLFIKNIIDNLFGFNSNNVLLYPVPDYQVLMNVRPDLYMNQNIYQDLFPKMIVPSGMLMDPIINFRNPYINRFNERNFKTTYPKFGLPAVGKTQRVVPVPNYNTAEVPLVRCHDKIGDSCRKNLSKDKAEKISSAFSKHESPNYPALSRETEEIKKDDDEEMLASSQFPPYKNRIETPTTISTPPFSTNVQELIVSHAVTRGPTISQPIDQPMAPPIEKNNEEITSKSPVREMQSLKTSTTSPSSTVNFVQTKLSSSYAKTTYTTETMQINTSTPPSSTNVKELITSHAVTINPTISQTRDQPMAPLFENNNEEITSKSPVRNIQSLKTSTTSPSSTLNFVQTNLSSSSAETTSTTKIMQINTSTPPSSTNVKELITSHAVTISPTISQTRDQPMAPLFENNNEEITSKSPVRNIQSLKTSTTSPSSTVNFVETNLSSSSAETTSTTKIMQINSSTPPSSTNVQELITSNAVTIGQTISQPKHQPMAPLIEKNNEEITSKSPERKNKSLKTSTTSPSSTVHLVQTNLSSSYAGTTSTIMQLGTSTPLSSTNVQELVETSKAVTLGPALTTLAPSTPLPVKYAQKNESLQPMLPLVEKKNEEIESTSKTRTPSISVDDMQPNNQDEINSNFSSQNLSKSIYKKNNSNNFNEDSVFKMENITYPKDIENTGDLMSQPSLFSPVIDVLNSINPIKGNVLNPSNIDISQDTDNALQEINSDAMELNDPTTGAYPSDTEELDYLNKSPVNLDEPSCNFDQEEGSQNKSPDNKIQDLYRWLTSSDSARETSRGDVPDV